jgi:hypothetical protein
MIRIDEGMNVYIYIYLTISGMDSDIVLIQYVVRDKERKKEPESIALQRLRVIRLLETLII